MNVKEWIEKLSTFPPETEVLICEDDTEECLRKAEIQLVMTCRMEKYDPKYDLQLLKTKKKNNIPALLIY